jgi:hypothetical protein
MRGVAKTFTTEKEVLAAVAARRKFYHYHIIWLPLQVGTDHNPLTSRRGLKDIGGHLQQFNFQF